MQYEDAFWQALDDLLAQSRIVIDRPAGSAHPRFPDIVYPLDYGYLEGTASMDGEGIDVWTGHAGRRLDAVVCTVDLLKRETELKLLIGCTDEEKQTVLSFHNATSCMKGLLVRR